MNPRALLCEIMGLSPEQAAPYLADERDHCPEFARALAAIQRFEAAVRKETVVRMNKLWAAPSPQAAQR